MEITYGVPPKLPEEPQLKRARQAFPLKNSPRRAAPGEQFFVRVTYLFDEPFAPCGGWKTFGFEVLPDGSIKALPPCDYVKLPPEVEKLALKMNHPALAE